MTHEEIIALAKEAGLTYLPTPNSALVRIVTKAVLIEREACAVLLARMTERRRWTRAGINGEAMMPCEYAEAIRARGAA